MSSIPRTDLAAIQFFTQHAAEWADHAAEVGLSQEEADQVVLLAYAAAEAHNRATAARLQAQGATLDMNNALEAMRKQGGRAIAKIRAHAAMMDGQEETSVLVTARLNPAGTRRAALPPARPTIVETKLLTTGAIKVRWRVRHTEETRAEGTQYLVMRMIPGLPGEDEWRMLDRGLVGGRGRKGHEFTDDRLPPAAALGRSQGEVRYQIIPQRAGVRGPASTAVAVLIGGGRFAGVGGAARAA